MRLMPIVGRQVREMKQLKYNDDGDCYNSFMPVCLFGAGSTRKIAIDKKANPKYK